MSGVTIFWDLMLKKIDVGYVEEMEARVKLSKVFSMTHCPEAVSMAHNLLFMWITYCGESLLWGQANGSHGFNAIMLLDVLSGSQLGIVQFLIQCFCLLLNYCQSALCSYCNKQHYLGQCASNSGLGLTIGNMKGPFLLKGNGAGMGAPMHCSDQQLGYSGTRKGTPEDKQAFGRVLEACTLHDPPCCRNDRSSSLKPSEFR